MSGCLGVWVCATTCQAVGYQLVLTAVNGSAIDDPQGMGQFRAALEAVKKAGRPIVLRLQRLPLVPGEPKSEPDPEPEPKLEPQPQPETEPEPELGADDANVGGSEVGGTRGAAATRKTRKALLGGLRSGTLEGAPRRVGDMPRSVRLRVLRT